MTAKGMGEPCDCPACRSFCYRGPGLFHPGQIPRLASKLGISEQELFRDHLAVELIDGADGEPALALRPADRTSGPGKIGLCGGQCVFFENGHCGLHSIEKPIGCSLPSHSTSSHDLLPALVAISRAWAQKRDWVSSLMGKPWNEVRKDFRVLSNTVVREGASYG